jgi:secreted PhoX family phosphatase
VTIADEDGTVNAGQLWVYEGTKKRSGNTVEKAGLTGGSLSIVKVVDDNGNRIVNDDAFRANTSLGQSRNFELASVSASKDGAAANTAASAAGTGLSRIEDGMFDPNNPNDYWFITTAGGSNNTANLSSGALWRLRFTDIANPSLGGKITMMLNSTSLPRTMSVAANGTVTAGTGLAMNMPDNLVVDAKGNILIQEDPGNNAVVSRIFAYRISDGAFAEIAHFDENRFTPGKSMFITQDEESSGIIEAPALGANTYLFDAQVHSAKELLAGTGAGTAAEYVEGGQLLRLTVKNWTNVYGS